MSNFLNEEIKRMNFLFGYKKGVVISEQSLENTPVGKVEGEGLGNAPDNIIKIFQSILDDKNTPQEVKDWCETQKNKFGEGVCVIGVSMDRETSRKKRVSNVNQLLHHYNKNYEDTALRQDDNGLYYRLSYVYGPKS